MTFNYKDKEYEISDALYEIRCQNDRKDELLAKAIDKKMLLTEKSVKELFKAGSKETEDEFIQSYKVKGLLDIPTEYKDSTKSLLQDLFENDNRFHGHAPKILDAIAATHDLLNQSETLDIEYVSKFNINAVKNMLDAGIPQMQAVMLYKTYDIRRCNIIAERPQVAENICSLISQSAREHNPSLLAAAEWISEHLRTNEKTIKKLTKDADKIYLDKDQTVEAVETKLSNLEATDEIKKIEKAYKEPGFKFKDCTCELKDIGKRAEDRNYIAYIMRPDDERQVLLGYFTHCCQKMGEAGESAMMHGLLNPKAGFWIVEDKHSGEIKCQAEVWEEDKDTLVFDNIELANDAELSLYKGIIAKWLEETSYDNVKMGTGYNHFMHNGNFRDCGKVTPTITPYEAYVLSYEDDSFCEGDAEEIKSVKKAKKLLEEERISYYDYVYCDSENRAVWMKEDKKLEPYFSGRDINLKQIEERTRRLNDEVITRYINLLFDLDIPLPEPDEDVEQDDYEEDDIFEEYEEDEYDEEQEL